MSSSNKFSTPIAMILIGGIGLTIFGVSRILADSANEARFQNDLAEQVAAHSTDTPPKLVGVPLFSDNDTQSWIGHATSAKDVNKNTWYYSCTIIHVTRYAAEQDIPNFLRACQDAAARINAPVEPAGDITGLVARQDGVVLDANNTPICRVRGHQMGPFIGQTIDAFLSQKPLCAAFQAQATQ